MPQFCGLSRAAFRPAKNDAGFDKIEMIVAVFAGLIAALRAGRRGSPGLAAPSPRVFSARGATAR
jgi:hypothetical protein